MFRRLWQKLFGKPTSSNSIQQSARLAIDADAAGTTRGTGSLQQVPARKLTAVCDSYWEALARPREGTLADAVSSADGTRAYNDYVSAINELANRGPEILQWAAARLMHPESDAREQAAFLVGEIAARHEVGENRDQIVKSLCKLAIRPMEEDGKEVQANSAALTALAKIGDRRAIVAIERILNSPEWEDDEIQFDAAESLGQLVGESFENNDDPVAAARQWLKTHRKA